MKKLLLLVSFGLTAVVPGSAAAAPEHADPSCVSISIDATPFQVPEEYILTAIGLPSVQYVTDTKISSQVYELYDSEGNQLLPVIMSCAGSCTGNGCGVSGCDPDGTRCSGCSCDGFYCGYCTCTKTTTQTH
jgi:hypothetical protein